MTKRLAAALIVWPFATFIGGLAFFQFGPRIEAYLAPVLVDQRIEIDGTDRSAGRMCWTWFWNKVRYAQPVVVSWSIGVDGTTVVFPLITERERDGQVVRNVQPASLGLGHNDLCVVIPQDMDHVTGLTIRGQINYRVPHGLWTIWQELPVVHVPPLP
jgi:hypothetical protein